MPRHFQSCEFVLCAMSNDMLLLIQAWAGLSILLTRAINPWASKRRSNLRVVIEIYKYIAGLHPRFPRLDY